jgi:hypothetical protein
VRHGGTEDGAEVADAVEDLAESAADHGVGSPLVCKAEASAEIKQVDFGIAVSTDAANAGNADAACVEVGETSGSRGVDGLGKDDVPADAVVKGEPRSDAPAILRVEAAPLLPVGRGGAVDVEALELRDLAFED